MAEHARDLPPELAVTAARERLADVVNEAAYAGTITYLTRRGRRLAAVVPAEAAEVLERLEDERDAADAAAVLAQLRAGKTGTRPWRELRSELGL